MSKILVTGGAGLIGNVLCEKLLDRGNEVYCLDNFSTSHKRDIERLTVNPWFHLIDADVVVYNDNVTYDTIFHLAAPASPMWYQHDPLSSMSTIVDGTKNILDKALLSESKVVVASTSEIYGDSDESVLSEEYYGKVNSYGPRSCYDESKRFVETLCYEYQKLGVDIKIPRIFNTYGFKTFINDGRVINEFVLNALRGDPLVVFGDGYQTRSFCYVTDTVEALILLCNSSYQKPINIGNDWEITINDLIKIIFRLVNSSSEVVYSDKKTNDPLKRRPLLSIAKEV